MAELNHENWVSQPPTRWRIADLTLDTRRQRVWRGTDEIPLPKLTYDLLVTLVRSSPAVLADEELMKAVWPGLVIAPETISQRVKLLRSALGDESRTPRYVGRLRGRGYHLVPIALALADEAAAPAGPVERAAAQLEAMRGDELMPEEELSLLESPNSGIRSVPDWAGTHVLPAPEVAALPAVAPPADVASPPAATAPPWLSWLLCAVAALVTGLVVYVLRMS